MLEERNQFVILAVDVADDVKAHLSLPVSMAHRPVNHGPALYAATSNPIEPIKELPYYVELLPSCFLPWRGGAHGRSNSRPLRVLPLRSNGDPARQFYRGRNECTRRVRR